MSATDPRAALDLVTTPLYPGPLLVEGDAEKAVIWHRSPDKCDATEHEAWIICVPARMLCLDGSYTPPDLHALRAFVFEDEAVHVYQKYRNGDIDAHGVVAWSPTRKRVGVAVPASTPVPKIPYRQRLAARWRGRR